MASCSCSELMSNADGASLRKHQMGCRLGCAEFEPSDSQAAVASSDHRDEAMIRVCGLWQTSMPGLSRLEAVRAKRIETRVDE
jgi:hypothetical protein